MKKSILSKIIVSVLCLVMVLTAIPAMEAQAASKTLTLKYKGKTLTVNSAPADCDVTDPELDSWEKFTTYKKVKKAFGTPKKDTKNSNESYTFYQYKEKGMLFSFYTQKDLSHIGGVTIKVTSKKAAVNGIKVGMSYSKVKKKLEKNYGKSLIKAKKNKKIELSYAGFGPVTYTFKKGKVSKIYFWCS